MGNKETQFWYGDAVIDGYSSDEGIEIWRRETTAFFSNLQKDKYRSVWSIMQPTVDEHQTPELSDDDAYALTHEDRMHDVSNWTFGVNHLPAFDAEVEVCREMPYFSSSTDHVEGQALSLASQECHQQLLRRPSCPWCYGADNHV